MYFINVYATEGTATDATVHHSHAEAAFEFKQYSDTWLATFKMIGVRCVHSYPRGKMEAVAKEARDELDAEKRAEAQDHARVGAL